MDDEHGAQQLRASLFQPGTDFVAVTSVVHHYKQDRFLTQRFMLGVALAPLLDAELQVVAVPFGKDGACVLL
jgi:hypothetical protein